MDLGLAGRGCVVTGAEGELGGAVVERLRAEGANVFRLGGEGDGLKSADVLVNALGAPASDDEGDDWHAHYKATVIEPLRTMRAVCPAMAERGWGRVVNVCSSAGLRPTASLPAHSVASAARLSLSRLFADHYGRSGVLVNAVCLDPAGADTDAAATAIVFLCSERASYVNGAAWSLDG